MPYISILILNFDALCNPLGPLIRKPTKYNWTEVHFVHFEAIKTRIAIHTKNTCNSNTHNPQFESRIKHDAYRSSLGAALKQMTFDDWKPISFASRIL